MSSNTKESKLVNDEPIINTPKTGKSELAKDINLKYETEQKRNEQKYTLYKELITRFFAPHFFSFILLIIIVIGGINALFKLDNDQAFKFWNLIAPLLTTYLGYAIGKKEK